MTSPTYLPRLDHSVTGDDAHPALGAVLLRSKLLTARQLDEALAEQVGTGKRLGEVLVSRGWLFPQDIARALAIQVGIDYIDIQHLSVEMTAARRLDPALGQAHCAVGVRILEDGTLLVAVGDPTSSGLQAIREDVGEPVAFAVAEEEDIQAIWRRLLQGFRP